jgi:hypothetical protein
VPLHSSPGTASHSVPVIASVSDMEAIAELEHEYFLLRFDWGTGERCVDWAVARLGSDSEGDDLEIVLLASARGRDEILPLVEVIVERYCGADRSSNEFAAGKYVAALRIAYLRGEESIVSLDAKFSSIYQKLGYPNWLTMLSRNCEYATDVPEFEKPFELEFNYVASLWADAKSLSEFIAKYSRDRSNQHNVVWR